jgi:hypothetical protein
LKVINLTYAAVLTCALAAVVGFAFLNHKKTAGGLPEPAMNTSVSPSKTFLADYRIVGDCPHCGYGITVRRLEGPLVYELYFDNPDPVIVFFKWIDDSHLQILSSKQLPATTRVKNDEQLNVSYSTYVRERTDAASVNAKRHVALAVQAADVTASVTENNDLLPRLKVCTLFISAKDGRKYSDISMSLRAGVYPCYDPPAYPGKHCAGIRSHFSVGQNIDNAGFDLLTSATVSELSSNNNLPDGPGRVGGGFIYTARALFDALKGTSFDIDYNFDFTEQNIRYTIPTSAVAAQISEFEQCIGPSVVLH